MKSAYVYIFAGLALIATSVFGSTAANACSCGTWSSFYQSAMQPTSQVAVVETLAAPVRGEVTAEIHDVLKGDVAAGDSLTIFGQDGLNCLGSLNHDIGAVWAVVFRATPEDGYRTLNCASTLLNLTDADTFAGNLFSWNSIDVSYDELASLIDGTALPTKSLTCSITLFVQPDIRYTQTLNADADGSINFEDTVAVGNEELSVSLNARYYWNRIAIDTVNPFTEQNLSTASMVNDLLPSPHASVSLRNGTDGYYVECNVAHSLPLSGL